VQQLLILAAPIGEETEYEIKRLEHVLGFNQVGKQLLVYTMVQRIFKTSSTQLIFSLFS
jgi:hypothetical protein